jgi:hypothetical protein
MDKHLRWGAISVILSEEYLSKVAISVRQGESSSMN